MDIFYYADFYVLGLWLTLELIFIVRSVRSGVRGRRFAAASAYFFGSFVTAALSFHTAENLWRIIPGTTVSYGEKPHYDFRFYALILFGAVMIVQGVKIMKAARVFVDGGETARSALFRPMMIALALAVPLIPIHVFASLTTIIGALALTPLAFASRKAALPVDALLAPKQLCLKINGNTKTTINPAVFDRDTTGIVT